MLQESETSTAECELRDCALSENNCCDVDELFSEMKSTMESEARATLFQPSRRGFIQALVAAAAIGFGDKYLLAKIVQGESDTDCDAAGLRCRKTLECTGDLTGCGASLKCEEDLICNNSLSCPKTLECYGVLNCHHNLTCNANGVTCHAALDPDGEETCYMCIYCLCDTDCYITG
jgi:hypothetical protein